MTCEEAQQAFSSYVDDQLAPAARAGCDAHLRGCPVCRAGLDEVRLLTRGLAALPRPVAPPALASSISDALRIEAGARLRQPRLTAGEKFSGWLRPRLMPYTIGSLASVTLFFAMLMGLRASVTALRDWSQASRNADEALHRANFLPGEVGYDLTQPITPEGYAARRAPFAIESPSLNPRGALAALTSSRLHGHDGDDDMMVVADVFSDGSASLAGVVQPPRDRRMLDEFRDALRQNAAFVPASYDRRPETMRVVFVLQKVKVNEREF